MKCSYCEKAILANQDSVDFGGHKLHIECNDSMHEEMAFDEESLRDEVADPFDYCDDDEEKFTEQEMNEYNSYISEGYDFGGQDEGYFAQQDNDPPPYSGDYSEM